MVPPASQPARPKRKPLKPAEKNALSAVVSFRGFAFDIRARNAFVIVGVATEISNEAKESKSDKVQKHSGLRLV